MALAAKSIIRYSKFFRHQGAVKVLDYGAGKLRNAAYLAKQGFTVFAADLPEQVAVLRHLPDARPLAGILDSAQLAASCLNVDLVLSTYVFNIISKSEEQGAYVANICRNLKPGGYLLMEVRCRQLQDCGAGCSHYFKCADCAKTYTHSELDQFLTPYGFNRISHYYGNHALAAVYQLEA
jgi:SAM-dependent methyltransferase